MTTQFAHFDRRGYPTTDVRSGYGEWAATYDEIVEDTMDIALLNVLQTPDWAAQQPALDLGCGTGRTGRWLHAQGIVELDGIDLTPEMLARAGDTGVYRTLFQGDITQTGLAAAAYRLLVMSLVDEHLSELAPLYLEALRLTQPGSLFVLVGFHPHFIMASGMPTHYRNAAGADIAISTHVHLLSAHINAAHAAGWSLVEMRERCIDDEWLLRKPKWETLRGHPVSFACVWQRIN